MCFEGTPLGREVDKNLWVPSSFQSADEIVVDMKLYDSGLEQENIEYDARVLIETFPGFHNEASCFVRQRNHCLYLPLLYSYKECFWVLRGQILP